MKWHFVWLGIALLALYVLWGWSQNGRWRLIDGEGATPTVVFDTRVAAFGVNNGAG